MNTLAPQIDKLKEWLSPRRAVHRGRECPFLLSCSFRGEPASSEELEGLILDPGLREFWMNTSSAELFKDQKYGQWGVEILSPSNAKAETQIQLDARPADFFDSDLVIGRFFGDAELLIMDTAQLTENGGAILVALPLYPRTDWPKVADSFPQFLERLLIAEGDKYWEERIGREVN